MIKGTRIKSSIIWYIFAKIYEIKRMKTNFTIKNFRVFDEKGVSIDFAPFTFLVGCNNSGKSSIVKSLTLLKSFFMHSFDKNHPVVGSTIDFAIKPNDSLGSFKNVVRSSSIKKEVSFSYVTHSTYLNEDVIVTLTMTDGELGNAIISDVEFSKKDGSVIYSSREGIRNPFLIKDSFKQFLIALRYRENYMALEAFIDPVLYIRKRSLSQENMIKEYEREALQYVTQDYLDEVLNERFIPFPHLNEYAKKAIDKFAETGILNYFAILDNLNSMENPEEISHFLKSRIKNGNYSEVLALLIDAVCEDYAGYQNKNRQSFLSYYRYLEDRTLFLDSSVSDLLVYKDDSLFDLFGVKDSIKYYYKRYNNRDRVSKVFNYAVKLVEHVSFSLVFDLLYHLSDEDPYVSVISKSTYFEDRMIHSLFYDTFREYVHNFILEIVSKDITEGLEYISSSRIQVRRMYPMEDRNEFSNAVKKYFETKSKYMTLNPPIKITVMDDDGNYDHKVDVTDFLPGSFMNKWLRIFKIGDHMSLEMDDNNLGLLLKVYRTESDKRGVLLADLGYGITQLFSILLQIEEMIMSGYYNGYNGKITSKDGVEIVHRDFTSTSLTPRTVAIEEPEIHLHPKYQSLLAEMFFEAYKEYNIQFIIETHSEYLLRKVQTLVGAKKLSSEEVSMIYVEDDEAVKNGAPKVRRIPIKDDGRLAEPFGPGFYDEADSLSMDLLRIKSDLA